MSKYKNYDERFTFEGAGGSGVKVLKAYLKNVAKPPILDAYLYANEDYTEFLNPEEVDNIYKGQGYLLINTKETVSDELTMLDYNRGTISEMNKIYDLNNNLIVINIGIKSGTGNSIYVNIPTENTPMPEDSGDDGQIINNPGDKGGSGTIITEG